MNIPHASEYTVNSVHSSHDRRRSAGYPAINGKPCSTFRDVVSTSRFNDTRSNRMTKRDWLRLDQLHREFHNM